jgi:hypothetical protein
LRDTRLACGTPMVAIATIFIFLLAIGALNRYEFGRFD